MSIAFYFIPFCPIYNYENYRSDCSSREYCTRSSAQLARGSSSLWSTFRRCLDYRLNRRAGRTGRHKAAALDSRLALGSSHETTACTYNTESFCTTSRPWRHSSSRPRFRSSSSTGSISGLLQSIRGFASQRPFLFADKKNARKSGWESGNLG